MSLRLAASTVCVLLFVAAGGIAQAQVRTNAPAGSPLALVLKTEGAVTVDGAAVSGGTLLTEGQALKLPAGALIQFSLITSCKELVVEGPGKASLEQGAVLLDGARLVESMPSPGCVKNDRVVLSAASQLSSGAVVVRGAPKGRVSPRAGVITSTRRRLRWDGPLADGRDVLVTITSGDAPDDPMHEVVVTGGWLELPDDMAWIPGASYAWSVEPAGLAPGPALAGSFRVAEPSIATQLEQLNDQATDAESWLRVAFFCEVHMLEADAAAAYAQALSRDPGSTGAAQRLAEIDLP